MYGGPGALTIEAILSTHKHWDHSGANAILQRTFAQNEKELRVYGHAVEKGRMKASQPSKSSIDISIVLACTHPVVDGDEIQIGDKLLWKVVSVRYDLSGCPPF